MGLSFTHEMWFRTLAGLSGYRAILLDNRGMGRSSVPRGPYSIRQMARDARAVLEAAGVTSAHVIGASMGGMIAQELALLYPDSVRSLVLACTTFSGVFGYWPDVRFGRWLLPSRTKARETDPRRGLTNLLYADSTPSERIDEDVRVITRCTAHRAGFYGQFAGILLWNSYYRLARITAPTLVLHGDQDRLIPIENGRMVARRIPGARFQIIKNAGHILTTCQPEACRDALLGFLAEQGRLSATRSE